MYYLLIIILIISIITKDLPEGIITAQYFGNAQSFTMRAELGDKNSESSTLYTTIDLEAQFTYSTHTKGNYCQIPRINFIRNFTKKINNKEYELSEYENKIYFLYYPDHYVKLYFILYPYPEGSSSFNPNSISTSGNGYGFASKFEDIKYSLVHQLYLQGKIKKPSFGVGMFDYRVEQGLVYFGGMDNKESIDKKYHGKCKVNDTYSTWSCDLHKIKIKDKEYNATNSYMYFQYKVNYIYVPYSFISFLRENVVNKYKDDCFEYDVAEYTKIRCSDDIFDVLPNIELYIGNTVFSIPLNKLFFEGNGDLDMEIAYNKKVAEKTGNDNTWIFGSYFLKKFSVYFDYDDKSISFYSDNIEIINQDVFESFHYMKKTLICFIILICFSWSLLIFFIHKKDNETFLRR